MTFIPNEQHTAILDAVKAKGNVAIDAGAGSGKSSSLLWLCETAIPRNQSTLICAFNKKIKEDMEGKVKAMGLSKVSVRTFNGLAFSAFTKKFDIQDSDTEMLMDSNKYDKLARWWVKQNLPKDRTAEQRREASRFLSSLISLFMCNVTVDHELGDLKLFVGGSLDGEGSLLSLDVEDRSQWRIIADRYDLYGIEKEEDEEKLVGAAIELLKIGRQVLDIKKHQPLRSLLKDDEKRPLSTALEDNIPWVDFIDQVYYAVTENWKVWQSSYVLVDEAQDLSPLDRALVQMHIYNPLKGGKLIMVGDPQQAIYKFRGADADGFSNSMIFWHVKTACPLSISWRCPKVVAELAGNWKPGFRAAPNAIEGEIAIINTHDMLALVQDGDALISRVRSAMIPAWRSLMKQGIPARIMGADVSKIIIDVLEDVAALEHFEYSRLADFLDIYQKKKVDHLRSRRASEEKVLEMVDNLMAVRAILQDIEAPTMERLIECVKKELDPNNMPKSGVLIMTAHGSKGGEWDNVFNITPDRFPLVYANQDEEDEIQENNLEYVMQTRTKRALFHVRPDAASYFKTAPVEVVVEPAAVVEEAAPVAAVALLPAEVEPYVFEVGDLVTKNYQTVTLKGTPIPMDAIGIVRRVEAISCVVEFSAEQDLEYWVFYTSMTLADIAALSSESPAGDSVLVVDFIFDGEGVTVINDVPPAPDPNPEPLVISVPVLPPNPVKEPEDQPAPQPFKAFTDFLNAPRPTATGVLSRDLVVAKDHATLLLLEAAKLLSVPQINALVEAFIAMRDEKLAMSNGQAVEA